MAKKAVSFSAADLRLPWIVNAGSSDPATLTISRAAARIVSAAWAPKRAKSSARAHHRRSETSSPSRRLRLANLPQPGGDGRQICPENPRRVSAFLDESGWKPHPRDGLPNAPETL